MRDHRLFRVENTSNCTYDFGINKDIDNLPALRDCMKRHNDRYLEVQEDILATGRDPSWYLLVATREGEKTLCPSAASDAILYEVDPDYRRGVNAKRREDDKSAEDSKRSEAK